MEREAGSLAQLIYDYDACGSPVADLLRKLQEALERIAELERDCFDKAHELAAGERERAELERDLAAAREDAKRWEAGFREAERMVDEHCYGAQP